MEVTQAVDATGGLFLHWLFEARIEVVDFDPQAVRAMLEWMQSYRDRPIDFANATLVWLAGVRNTSLIITTDYRDFRALNMASEAAGSQLSITSGQ